MQFKVPMYVLCMYVCMNEWMNESLTTPQPKNKSTIVCQTNGIYVCMHACTHTCTHACLHTHTYMNEWMKV